MVRKKINKPYQKLEKELNRIYDSFPSIQTFLEERGVDIKIAKEAEDLLMEWRLECIKVIESTALNKLDLISNEIEEILNSIAEKLSEAENEVERLT